MRENVKTTENVDFKSGFIALVGRPNSGKSSLLNNVLKENLSIVTPLPQTTRTIMRGIYSTDSMQLIFVDTPGVHKGKHMFNKTMLDEVRNMFFDGGIDCICYIVDCSREFGSEEEAVVSIVRDQPIHKLIVFNKIDIVDNADSKIEQFFTSYPDLKGIQYVKCSALDKKSGDVLVQALNPLIPQGPAYFDPENSTDATLRFFAAEYLRKYIILNTKEEVPHAAFVEIESYKETPECHEILATIHVETSGQKGIIIGKGGSGIDKIKKGARKEMKELVGMPVTLTCHVKVTPGWRDNESFLRRMGLAVRRG
jgi:GTP-binding protein Era